MGQWDTHRFSVHYWYRARRVPVSHLFRVVLLCAPSRSALADVLERAHPCCPIEVWIRQMNLFGGFCQELEENNNGMCLPLIGSVCWMTSKESIDLWGCNHKLIGIELFVSSHLFRLWYLITAFVMALIVPGLSLSTLIHPNVEHSHVWSSHRDSIEHTTYCMTRWLIRVKVVAAVVML